MEIFYTLKEVKVLIERWRHAQRTAARRWPDRVVMMSPLFDQHFRLLQRVEDFHVQYLVSELAVEALVVTVLLGRSWFDE